MVGLFRGVIAVAAVTVALAAGQPALAQTDAAKPLKVSTGKPYGSAQTNTTIKDSMVDGAVLRVTVTQPNVKPWDAGVNSFIGVKLKENDKVEMTLWLRASQVAAGQSPKVIATLQDNGPPRVEFTKATFTLTEKWAPYKYVATIPKDMPAHSVMVGMQLGSVVQTVDIGAVVATKIEGGS